MRGTQPVSKDTLLKGGEAPSHACQGNGWQQQALMPKQPLSYTALRYAHKEMQRPGPALAACCSCASVDLPAHTAAVMQQEICNIKT